MKHLFLSILLSVVFLPIAFATDYSGKCGENLTWSLDVNTGVLTISGTGPMDNYDGSISRPWNSSTIQNAIKSIIIEEGVTTIGNKAFESLKKLISVSFPKSLTSIGESAFSNSDALESVNISGNTTIDGNNAFNDCDGLKSVILSGNTIIKGQRSFKNCDGLKKVLIETNVQLIGEESFYGCDSLSSVKIKDGITELPRYSFQDCPLLSDVLLPSTLRTIRQNAFTDCSSLEQIQLPDSLEKILDGAFSRAGLTSITIPINASVYYGVFSGCNQLKEATVYGIYQSYSDLFDNCRNLETLYWRVKNSLSWSSPIGTGHKIAKVYIGEEVDTIPEDLCDAFTNLNYVEIGRNVKHIGDYAFQNCKNLKEIRIHAEIPPSIGLFGFFMTASEDVSVVVPCNSVTAYKESYFYNGYGWNNMTILADDDCPNTQTYTVSVSSANTSMGTVSGGGEYKEGITATVTATPKSGYKFTTWSDGTTKNPYTFTVTKNVTLTAYFEKESSSSTNEITCEEAAAIAASLSHNTPTAETYTVIGYVTETDGVVSRNQQIFWMADTPNGGNVFQSYWGNVTEAVAVGDKVSLTGQIMRYNSTYEIKNGDVVILSYGYSPQTYTVSVSSANTSMGTVSGSGEYEEGERAIVTATPKSGYRFTKWSDGTTKNPYTFTVTKDVSLTAYFEKESSTPYEITCEEAAAIAAELEHNTPTEETYTVIGYVTETDGVISREQQRFWMADTPNGGNVFQSYWGNVTEALAVGDKVSLTGQIMRYNSTYQIKNGDVVLLQRESQDLFWNFSNSIFNSLGTISTTKTINGLTINATSSGTVVIDASAQTIDNISFTHRLKLNGTGSANYRSLKFNIAGDCTIDIYLKSANSSESRTLRIDYGAFNSSNNHSISATSSIAKRTVSYTGNATTVYVYGTNGGVNLYGIRINYNSSTPPDDPTKITCSEAADIAADLDHNSPTNETYTVVGYVTETNGYVTDQSRQVFWMADTKNGGQVFQSYYGNVTEAVQVGDYVSLTGQIKRYNTTPQIQHGDVTILSQETGVDDVVIHKTFDKILRDGNLLIIRDDKTYNVMGQEL